MRSALDHRDMLLAAWRTNNRVTVFLLEHLPDELWGATVPGAPRRTVRMIAGHSLNDFFDSNHLLRNCASLPGEKPITN